MKKQYWVYIGIVILTIVLSIFIALLAFPTQEELTPLPTHEPPLIQSLDYDEEDRELLIKVSAALAPDADLTTKKLIMCLVLNRSFSPEFPDSVLENVWSLCSRQQLDNAIPSELDLLAEAQVSTGWDYSQNCLYYTKTEPAEYKIQSGTDTESFYFW